MSLQVAEGAVVGHQLEPVVGAFEGAARAVAPVAPIAHVGPKQRHPLLVAEEPHPAGGLALGARQVRETSCNQDFLFAVGVVVEQRHLDRIRRGVGGLPPAAAAVSSGHRLPTRRAMSARVVAR